AANGEITDPAPVKAAKERLRATFAAAPYRPTGLATRDQALSSVVQLLDWAAAQVRDAFDGHISLAKSCPEDRRLLARAASAFTGIAALLQSPGGATPRTPRRVPDGKARIPGMPSGPGIPDLDGLEQDRAAATAHLRELAIAAGDEPSVRMA